VIPARLGSTRLPDKPLRLLAAEPLIRVVARRVLELDLTHRVVVAADHPRVLEAVAPLGVDGVVTDPNIASGTERVAAVLGLPEYADAELILNVQGDEPFVPQAAAAGAVQRVAEGDAIATAAAPLTPEAALDPNRVKVVVDEAGRALRFARALPASGAWSCAVEVLHHIGVYAYSRRGLLGWVGLPPAPAELAEGLEQLRPLAHGIPVGVARIREAPPPGIDTPDDLIAAEDYVNAQSRRVGR
jgi:3-deoxy-manno-octulosonate cytidylyltransferase (CMP-KDO synthetase)